MKLALALLVLTAFLLSVAAMFSCWLLAIWTIDIIESQNLAQSAFVFAFMAIPLGGATAFFWENK